MGVELMDKGQAYKSFWNSFGLKAYDETSVPDNEPMPYITFEMIEDDFGHSVGLTASIFYRSSSWIDVVAKSKEIEAVIGRGGVVKPFDGGAMWIKKANPWARRSTDENDDSVRRIILNIEVEFID